MSTNSVPASSTQPPSRRLWQVPLFLLGTVALTSYLLLRPTWNNPLARSEARLDQARKLWADRKDEHSAKVFELVQYYLDHAGLEPTRAAEAHFLWGTTLLRNARKESAENATPLWQQGHQRLILARDLGLEEQDMPRLRAALGEAGFHTNDDLANVIRLLSPNLEGSDNKAEAARVLTLACLKKQPPDLEAALQANEWLRQQPLIGEEILGPARLQGGEILLRLRRPAEARKVLEKIARDASTDLLARARTLRALSHQDEGQWNEAAALWQEVLKDPHQTPSDLGEVLYHLGVCQRRLHQREEAIRTWNEAIRRGDGEAVAAASLGLAELLLANNDPAALDHLLRSVRTTRTVADWKNPFVEVKRARELFEQGCRVALLKQDYEKALETAQAYDKIALPGMASYLRGLVLRDWGLALLRGNPADKSKAPDMLRQAGIAFESSADSASDQRERGERLWLAANGHHEGGDPKRSVAVLERFLAMPGHGDDRNGEAWYLLAVTQEGLKKMPEAEAAFRRSISFRSKFAYRARYRLSEIELARGETDRAVDMLEKNIKDLRLDPDEEAMEKSLFSYGHLLYLRREYSTVRPILEEGLTRYPTSFTLVRGRFELADTYRQLAAQEHQNFVQGSSLTPETRDHFLKQRRMWLTKAAEQYQLLSQALSNDPKAAAVLTQMEQVQVYFSVADCRFLLGDYGEALKLYDELADRYKGRLERISALGGTARCYAAQRDFSRYKSRLDDIRVALKDADTETRREWERWLSVAGKGQ